MIQNDPEMMKKLAELCFGWITPENTILPCASCTHIKVLPSTYQARYDELCDRYIDQMNEILNEEQQNLTDDDYYHPAMHRFSPELDAMFEFLAEVYEEGYVRIGYYSKVLEVCGNKDRIESLSNELDFIVDVLGLKKWTRRH